MQTKELAEKLLDLYGRFICGWCDDGDMRPHLYEAHDHFIKYVCNRCLREHIELKADAVKRGLINRGKNS